MFETLFDSELPLAVLLFIAFLILLALSWTTYWFLRTFYRSRRRPGEQTNTSLPSNVARFEQLLCI